MSYLHRLFIPVLLLLACSPLLAQQQKDINRYTLFTGFDYLISPARNLTERGFEGDFGVTVRSWLGVGGDFSAMGSDVISGAGTIRGGETVYATAVNTLLGPGAADAIHVPFKSTTYTFAAGPQFYIRTSKRITFLVRPGLGGIHENANITFPSDLGLIFEALQIPPPSAHQTDTEFFFGVGGGFDVNVSKRIGVRFATDWVNTHLFPNLLSPRQNYIRFSMGPTWKWGHYR
ncbi:MAG TPA: hypothetical protein VMX38_17650 [Verrucomicrobiae bacterium]|jgi:opacity protein-like surface antigen|nr:hypothetical protein [Verrucomicrobiae bacterium]